MRLNTTSERTFAHACVRSGLTLAAAAWAFAQSTVPAAANDTPTPGSEDVQVGFRIMQDVGSGNCVSCHALPGQTGLTSNFAPSLVGIGARMDASDLRQWVFDARRIKPDTLMPPFGTLEGLNRTNPSRPVLNERQIQQVVAALQTLR